MGGRFELWNGTPDPFRVWCALPPGGRAALDSLAEGPDTGRWSILCGAPQARLVWKDDALEALDPDGVLLRRFAFRTGGPFGALREALRWFGGEAAPAAMAEARAAAAEAGIKDLPFVVGGVGWLSYELGRRLEQRSFPGHRADVDPPLEFGLFGGAILIERSSGRTMIVAADTMLDSAGEVVRAMSRALEQASAPSRPLVSDAPARPSSSIGWIPSEVGAPRSSDAGRAETEPLGEPSFDSNDGSIQQAHRRGVKELLARIEAGELYQANLSVRFRKRITAGADELWGRMRKASPEPFAACLEGEDRTVLCASMERFLRVRNRTVESRPIKGTRPRGDDPASDARAREELVSSEKDRAELLMIVDVHRNDLGRVCAPGSVTVSTLFGVRSFARVHHLEAAIEGRLSPDKDLFDALHAAFPAGSITGAPKIRAMQVLETLEPEPRGVYCGAVGYLGLDETADFAVAIRTAVLKDAELRWSAGGGIVWDSVPDAEWNELLTKASTFRDLTGSRD